MVAERKQLIPISSEDWMSYSYDVFCKKTFASKCAYLRSLPQSPFSDAARELLIDPISMNSMLQKSIAVCRQNCVDNDEDSDLWYEQSAILLSKFNEFVRVGETLHFVNSNPVLGSKASENSGCFLNRNNTHVFVNPVARRCFSALEKLVPRSKFVFVMRYASAFHLLCDIGVNAFVSNGKLLTEWAKKCSYLLGNDWPLLVNLENFAGYNSGQNLLGRSDEIRDWGEGTVFRYDEQQLELFRECMLNVVLRSSRFTQALENVRERKDVCLREFVADPDNWVTSGAGNVDRLTFRNDEGDLVTTKKNRALIMLKYDVERIVRGIFDVNDNVNMRPAIKIELGRKGRIIIVGNDWLQIAMSYVSFALGDALELIDNSPIFMSSSKATKAWISTINTYFDTYAQYFHLPYDAPSFDQNVSTDELDVFYSMLPIIANSVGLSRDKLLELLDVIDVIRVKLSTLKCDLPCGGQIEWNHGIASGVRWTSVKGTIISITRMNFAMALVKSVCPLNIRYGFLAAGDDVHMSCNDLVALVILYYLFKNIGWGAKETKNWVSDKNSEFLRRVISKQGTIGYLCRRIPGLLYRDPTKAPIVDPNARLRERASGIKILAERGADLNVCLELLFKSTKTIFSNKGRQKMSNSASKTLLYTTSTAGGLGLVPSLPAGSRGLAIDETLDSELSVKSVNTNCLHSDYIKDVVSLNELKAGRSLAFSSLLKRISVQVFQIDDKVFPLNPKGVKVVEGSAKMFDVSHSWGASLFNIDWHHKIEFNRAIASQNCINAILSGDIQLAISFTHIQSITILLIMFKHWKRALLIKWVRGELKFRMPFLLNISDQNVVSAFKMISSIEFRKLLFKHRVSESDWLRTCQTVERSTSLSVTRFPFSKTLNQ